MILSSSSRKKDFVNYCHWNISSNSFKNVVFNAHEISTCAFTTAANIFMLLGIFFTCSKLFFFILKSWKRTKLKKERTAIQREKLIMQHIKQSTKKGYIEHQYFSTVSTVLRFFFFLNNNLWKSSSGFFLIPADSQTRQIKMTGHWKVISD